MIGSGDDKLRHIWLLLPITAAHFKKNALILHYNYTTYSWETNRIENEICLTRQYLVNKGCDWGEKEGQDGRKLNSASFLAFNDLRRRGFVNKTRVFKQKIKVNSDTKDDWLWIEYQYNFYFAMWYFRRMNILPALFIPSRGWKSTKLQSWNNWKWVGIFRCTSYQWQWDSKSIVVWTRITNRGCWV